MELNSPILIDTFYALLINAYGSVCNNNKLMVLTFSLTLFYFARTDALTMESLLP
jgi:hypothetical protein